MIENKMDEAEEALSRGKKQPKKDAVKRARHNVLIKYGIAKPEARKFADPASMF